MINSIFNCVTCRSRLRGKQEVQKMADLPPEHLSTSPTFTYVGLDIFGLWTVVTRCTRGSVAENKRWAILFTCMSPRAVHIEVIESMNTTSCITLQRFFCSEWTRKTDLVCISQNNRKLKFIIEPFWSRWQKENISTLQPQCKWQDPPKLASWRCCAVKGSSVPKKWA